MDELTYVQLDHEASPGESWLRCTCGESTGLHQDQVTVFNRDGEDSDSGLCVHVDGQDCQQSGGMNGNPSDRRDGLLIGFWCEYCGQRSTMDIHQHKGTTVVRWKSVEPIEADATAASSTP